MEEKEKPVTIVIMGSDQSEELHASVRLALEGKYGKDIIVVSEQDALKNGIEAPKEIIFPITKLPEMKMPFIEPNHHKNDCKKGWRKPHK